MINRTKRQYIIICTVIQLVFLSVIRVASAEDISCVGKDAEIVQKYAPEISAKIASDNDGKQGSIFWKECSTNLLGLTSVNMSANYTDNTTGDYVCMTMTVKIHDLTGYISYSVIAKTQGMRCLGQLWDWGFK